MAPQLLGDVLEFILQLLVLGPHLFGLLVEPFDGGLLLGLLALGFLLHSLQLPLEEVYLIPLFLVVVVDQLQVLLSLLEQLSLLLKFFYLLSL